MNQPNSSVESIIETGTPEPKVSLVMTSAAELNELYESRFSPETFGSYPPGLYDPVKHIMSIKGKRIRPMLVLLACDLFGGSPEEALDAAFAVEVFHNFTLVHDDIMDEADLRRGQPTVHKVYGLNKAILAGDVMFSYAFKHLLKLPIYCQSSAMTVFNKAAIEIFEGQQMDMDFESRMDVPETDYLKMIEYKTSVLLAAALQMGSLIAGAPDSDQEKIYQFGLNLGLSFQIKDDYLDAFGASDKVGKKEGGDIIQNKKTFLLITALNKAEGKDKEELLALLNEKDAQKKVSGVKALMEKLDVTGITLRKTDELYEKSLASLRAIEMPEENKQALLTLAKGIHEREF